MRQLIRALPAFALAASLAWTTSASAQNGGVSLTDVDAIFDYAWPGVLPTVSNGPSGNVSTNFQLGGAHLAPNTNWIKSGNWFYRIQGDDRERQFANAGLQIPTGANEVEYVFPQVHTGGALNTIVPNAIGHMAYHVFDTGVDSARMETEACIENTGNTPITYTTYAVFDIDVLGTTLGDTYGPMTIGATRILSATDGLGTAVMIGPGASSGGVADFATIMGNMIDVGVDSLPDTNPGGFGPGVDAVAFMQFSNQVAAPHSFNCTGISVDINIAVPEPTTAVLLSLAVVAAGRLRRRTAPRT